MTENIAIKKHIEECKHRIETIQGYVKRSEDANKKECETNIYILESIIQALEENQQYHASGTIEECREAMKKLKAYGDTKLTPEQILEIDQMYRTLCEQLAKLQAEQQSRDRR